MSEEAPTEDNTTNLKLIIGTLAGSIFLIGGLMLACKDRNFNYALVAFLGSAVIIWTTASENAGTTLEILGGLIVGIGAVAGISTYVRSSGQAPENEDGYQSTNIGPMHEETKQAMIKGPANDNFERAAN